MWSRVGVQTRIPSAGQNRRAPVFGALDAVSGRAVAWVAPHKRSGDFIAFILYLLGRYENRHLFLFLDNCSIHKAKRVRRILADLKDRVTLIWNAAYTPELNLIERYWGHLKSKAIHNYYFGTIEDLTAAIYEAVTAMNRGRRHRMSLDLNMAQSFRGVA